MRDKGLDKGLIRYFDDAHRNYRGQEKNFFGFRKMFRDYLAKLNVAYYDKCCPAATTAGIVPVRYNDSTNILQYYNVATDSWSTVDAGALVSDSITLDDGLVSALAIRIGADANNGLYGVSDTVLGVAVEGVQVATFGTSAMAVNGVTNIGATMIAAFYPQVAQNNITAGAGGAIIVTNYLTTINTDAGGDAFTLANGTVTGQMKKILLVVDGGGDGVVTPATAFAGGATTATFNDAGDYLILQWNGTAWRVQENFGVTVA